MNKLGTFIFFIVLLLCVGNVYSIDHSLGGDLDIKPSVVDKMKKEKFTYSYKELKNRKRDMNKQCSTFRGKAVHYLNLIAKGGEHIKTSTEKLIDNCNMKKLFIFLTVGAFVLWYIRRVIKNSFLNKKKINIYFNESGTYHKKSYQDMSYPYYDNNSYLSNSHQYLNSYNHANSSSTPSPKTSRFFSQRKRKNSNDGNANLYSYAYV